MRDEPGWLAIMLALHMGDSYFTCRDAYTHFIRLNVRARAAAFESKRAQIIGRIISHARRAFSPPAEIIYSVFRE